MGLDTPLDFSFIKMPNRAVICPIMNSLKNFQPVIDALSQVAKEASVANDNGTANKQYICHYWDNENVYDKNRAALDTKIAIAVLSGQLTEVTKLREDLAKLPQAKVNMVFKLMEPIRRVQGTKIVIGEDEKTYSPSMTNVEYLYIPEDAVEMELLQYEEVKGEMGADRNGEDTNIINLKLVSGMIDVKEALYDKNSKMIRAARCSVTAISYRAMQVAGKIMYNNKEAKRKVYGMDIN